MRVHLLGPHRKSFLGYLASLLLALAAGTLGVGKAVAEPGFDANRYLAPPLASDGATLARPQTLVRGAWGGTIALSHADDALVGRLSNGGERQIIGEQLWLYGFVAYGLLDWLTLHGSLPVPIRQAGDTEGVERITTRLHDFAVGDLKLGGRLRLSPRGNPTGLALDAALLIPTGSREAFASDGKVRVQATAIAEVRTSRNSYVGGNLGVLTRPEIEVAGTTTGTLLQLAATGGLRTAADTLRLGVEANLQVPFEHAGASYEIFAAGKIALLGGLHAAVAAGPGLGAGWQTPDFRAVARIGWAPTGEDSP